MATKYGTPDDDLINGTELADDVRGFDGSDTLYGNGGDDVIRGGTATPADPLAWDGDDLIDGGAGNDKAFGGSGNDVIIMGDGDDTADGGRGDDVLMGGDGLDTFMIRQFAGDEEGFGGNYDEIADFTVGTDKLNVTALRISSFDTIRFLLSANEDGDTTLEFGLNGYLEGVRLIGVSPSSLKASDFILSTGVVDDVLEGSQWSNDDLFGGRGNDTLSGLEGDDRLFGEDGDDTLYGESPEAESYGSDLLVGGIGNDKLYGNAGQDKLNGGTNDDLLDGGSDNDTISTGAGADTVVYAPHEQGELDIVTDFNVATDKIDLRAFNISSFETIASLIDVDSKGNSTLTVNYGGVTTQIQLNRVSTLAASNFVFDLVAVKDTITGTDYNDDIFGAVADDKLYGGDGYDRIYGEDGNDVLTGSLALIEGDSSANDGDDILHGGAGNDTLYAGGGNDLLVGGAGNDVLYGQLGSDEMFGGAGIDGFSVRAYADGSTDHIRDFELAFDRLYVSAFGISSLETMHILMSGDVDGNTVLGIRSGGQVQTIVIDNTFPDDFAAGNFLFSTSTAGTTKTGTSGGDDLFGGLGNDIVKGGEAEDRVFGEQGDDILYGGSSTSTALEAAGGYDQLYGGDGNDTLYGGGENDILVGGAGIDQLFGGLGNDRLAGGAGADSFKFDRAVANQTWLDTIVDFSQAQGDKIDLSLIDANAAVTGNQAFVLVDGNPITAAGQVRIFYQGAYTYVEGNVNSVLSQDFQIRIAGRPEISVDDLIL